MSFGPIKGLTFLCIASNAHVQCFWRNMLSRICRNIRHHFMRSVDTLFLQVSELVGALEKLSRNSEIRHQQSAEFINDLKRANRYNWRIDNHLNIHYTGPSISNLFTNERSSVYLNKHNRMSLDTKDYFVKHISHLSKGVVIVASE